MKKRSVSRGFRFLLSATAVALLLVGAGCYTNFTGTGLQARLPTTPAAEQRSVTLNTFFAFNPSHFSPRYRLPAGRYQAAFEDEHFIYFPAPAKLREVRMGFASFEYDGGLYLVKGPHRRWGLYCSMDIGGGGPWQKFDLPAEFLAAEGRTFFIEPPLAH
jgi:hypothetical protein